MRRLLDTHALLWWLDGDQQLPQAAQRAVGDAVNEVLVSDASAREVATKVRIGKLPDAVLVAERFGRNHSKPWPDETLALSEAFPFRHEATGLAAVLKGSGRG